jgi:hypothetical protein
VLLHRLQERGLRLGRRAVDFIREQDVGEDRTGSEYHLSTTRLRVLLDDVRACNVRRHEVRRELNARELEVHDLRDRVDKQRLRETWHAHDQAVAADEEREQDLFDDVLLTDDQLMQLADDPLAAVLHLVRECYVVWAVQDNRSDRIVRQGFLQFRGR